MLSYRSKLSLNPRICLESDTAVKFTPVVSFTHPVSSLAVPCHPAGFSRTSRSAVCTSGSAR